MNTHPGAKAVVHSERIQTAKVICKSTNGDVKAEMTLPFPNIIFTFFYR